MRKLYSTILALLLLAVTARASHIVGGEITYVYLGNNNYRIVIDIYQDCKDGQQSAIDQDVPALLGVFYNDGTRQAYISLDTIGGINTSSIDVPANFSNSCINRAPDVCLKRRRFTKTYPFPPSNRGYIIVYQRCCRNASVLNINQPGNTGATYFAVIPPQNTATQNNSAVFKNYPPQIICINTPLVYDHSAYDVDGDSLSYEFCQAYRGGAPDDAKPDPAPPPFFPVAYAPPFTAANPMRGSPTIQIDSRTGKISGTPTLLGRYVVSVCVSEWRNGVKINTVTREFQFVVTDCSKAVVANTPLFSEFPNTYIVNCRDRTVLFKNTSVGGFDYHWDFGVNGATSTEFEPTFTYPDTGTYIVKLLVNKGTTCPDSIERIVKIYPNFDGDFEITGLRCPNSDIQFTDLSTSTYDPINFWSWDFGDSQFSGEQNPVHRYPEGGLYRVTLFSGNGYGCRDTTVKELDIERFKPYAGNDTIIVKGEYINFAASGGVTYVWSPGTYLDYTNIYNPIGRYPDTGTFSYNVNITSQNNCVGDDSITVRVVGQSSYFVPSAFSPNGDGNNDVFRPRAVGYRSVDYFRVFNRYGQMVWESKDFSQGWDGTFNGNKADIGTYFYMLKMVDRFGQPQTAKGDVILVR